MEFGPRALGARSILGDPRSPRMQATMNLKIKFRESFRPFAPGVLAGASRTSGSTSTPSEESPYMLLVAPVRARAPACRSRRSSRQTMAADPDLRNRVNVPRRRFRRSRTSTTAPGFRPSMASAAPRFHRLLERVLRGPGCPVLVNTSFNVRGEPIVCTPADAYRCFLATDMDALVLEDHVMLKEDMRQAARTRLSREEYLAQFQLD